MLFLWRTLSQRRRSEPFLSVTLLLAISPLIIFSVVSYLQLVRTFWASEHNRLTGHYDTYAMGLQVGHAYQLGVVLSATLLLIHSLAYALIRIGRNA